MKKIKDTEQCTGRIKWIISAVLCGTFLMALFVRSEAVTQRLKLLQAAITSDSEKKIDLYTESLGAGDDLNIQKKLIEAYTEEGSYESAGNMVDTLLGEYPEDAWLKDFRDTHTPAVPKASAPAGTYEEDLPLSFSVESALENGGSDYGTEIVCSRDGEYMDISDDGTGLVLSENGSYVISLYTRNAFGFQSDCVEYTYVIDKLIPQPVEAGVASGYFCEPLELELEQPEGYPVYYTLDGSAPTESSTLYDSPIAVESGRTLLRTAACSPTGTMGEERTYYYHIRPWSSGLESLGIGLITAHGDYFCRNGMLSRYEDGVWCSTGVSLGDSYAFCEYEDGILFCQGTVMKWWSPFTDEVADYGNTPGNVSFMLNAGGTLCLVAQGKLYCWKDGQTEPLAEGLEVHALCASRDGRMLFIGCGDGIYTLFLPDRSLNRLLESGDVTSVAFGDDRLYYCVGRQNVYSFDPQSGALETIEEGRNDYSHIEPSVQPGRMVRGSETTITTACDSICFANGRAYYHYTFHQESSGIPWVNWNARVDTVTHETAGWKTFGQFSAVLMEEDKVLIGNGYCMGLNSGAVIAQ